MNEKLNAIRREMLVEKRSPRQARFYNKVDYIKEKWGGMGGRDYTKPRVQMMSIKEMEIYKGEQMRGEEREGPS